MPHRIAVDAMGGDHAPVAVVEGAVSAARGGLAISLVGPADRVRAELARHAGVGHLPIDVIDAPDVIQMDESPLAALRRKPRASVKVACELVAAGEAAAAVTAGHTGAMLLSARTVFGLLDDVERPALAVTIPTRTGSAILLDAGANVECRAEHLVQFAVMGAAYARVAIGCERPKVGLLSIGEEPGKGTDAIREAHAALSRTSLDFIGNIDAHAVFTGAADVVVCDGFTGNVVLKAAEGLAEMIQDVLKAELMSTEEGRRAAMLAQPALTRLAHRMDDAERGAVPLLGVRGLALVGHGRSSPRAIEGALKTAARLANEGMLDRLMTALAALRP